MALGGVDTGNINPQLAPKVAPIAGGIGFTSAAIAKEIITGTTIFAEAVLEEVSLTNMATNMAPSVIPHICCCAAQLQESLTYRFSQFGVEHEISERQAATK